MTSGRLSLLDGFELTWDGQSIPLPPASQRVLAFLALQPRPVQRHYVAGTLWAESSSERAAGNLRSSLWRLGQRDRHLVRTIGTRLTLAPTIDVDVHEVERRARDVIWSTGSSDGTSVGYDVLGRGDLLPDWPEDWVIVERERIRQLHSHALERACAELVRRGLFAQAIDFGLAAVHEEPLHDTAHGALIGAYLAEGNRADALRQFSRYTAIMRDELDLGPSPHIASLLEAISDPPGWPDEMPRGRDDATMPAAGVRLAHVPRPRSEEP